MRKNNFIIFSLNKYLLPALFCVFTLCLIIFSKENLIAAKSGIFLWVDSVLPALLPFFIATELLSHTRIVSLLGRFLNKIMRPLFNVPGIGSFAFIMGIISGYPVGAKIVTNFRESNLCTKEEGERLLAFTNNSGPLFIIGTVGISLFGNPTIGFTLLTTHILGCITVGLVFKYWKFNYSANTHYRNTNKNNEIVTLSNLGNILGTSIKNSINTVVMIGGFVVLFSVIISILKNGYIISTIGYFLTPIANLFNISSEFISGFITGIIELTNGVNCISNIRTPTLSISLIICSFLLGFGGISILLQVYSIISKSDVSIKPYIYGKLLHGFFSAIYTYIAIKIIPMLNFDLNFKANFSLTLPIIILLILLYLFIIKKRDRN